MSSLLVVYMLSLCLGVYSHGYLSKPTSRNKLRCNGEFYCETHVGTQNVNGLPQPVYPNNLAGAHPGMGRIAEPVCASGLEDGRHNGLEQPGPIQATFNAGQTIDVTIEIQANHGGQYAFRLCADASGTEDCFSKHHLQFENGEMWKRLVHDSKGGSNYLQDRVKLPAGVGCDKCVLSWRWDSGDRPGEGGDESAIFVNCVDIRITGGGNANPDPGSNPTPGPSVAPNPEEDPCEESDFSPTPAPADSDEGEVPRGACAGDGDDCSSSRCCATPGKQCYQKDQHWASCRDSCTPGGINPDDPPQYKTPWSCVRLSRRLASAGNGCSSLLSSAHGQHHKLVISNVLFLLALRRM